MVPELKFPADVKQTWAGVRDSEVKKRKEVMMKTRYMIASSTPAVLSDIAEYAFNRKHHFKGQRKTLGDSK